MHAEAMLALLECLAEEWMPAEVMLVRRYPVLYLSLELLAPNARLVLVHTVYTTNKDFAVFAALNRYNS
jgi:hypothetical protein